MGKKATKKATKKRAAKKSEPEVIRITVPADLPLSEIEMAAAFNVPTDDPLRKAYAQKIKDEIAIAATLLQGKAENHGKLAEAVGWFNAINFLQAEMESLHKSAQSTIMANAATETPQQPSTGY